jgi:hypothetical protein
MEFKGFNMIGQSGPRSGARLKRVGVAVVMGFLLTLGLNGLAFSTGNLGYPLLSKMLIWPNTLLQSLIPLNNIGTAERPIMEGTPLNVLAFIASIPLAWFVYFCIAYVWLASRKRSIV